jgi:hypothetical protein
MLFLTPVVFGVAWWLGLYLIVRDPRNPLLRRSGIGLLAYALALVIEPLYLAGGSTLLRSVATALAFLPAMWWVGAALRLLPESPRRHLLEAWWQVGLLPVYSAALLAATFTGVFNGARAPAPAYLALGALVLMPLIGCLLLLVRERHALRPAGFKRVVIVMTIFLGLGTALLLTPFDWLPRAFVLLSIGFDLAWLGVAVTVWDAFDAGETLRRDMLRSLIAATAAALLFGGLVGLTMAFGATITPCTSPMSPACAPTAAATRNTPTTRSHARHWPGSMRRYLNVPSTTGRMPPPG